jgi:RNA polymerase sigma factor (sigma-70 family)
VTHVAVERDTASTDAELLRKIAEGDLACLGVLFDRYGADVRGFVSRLGVASGEVDDVVQSTFLLVMRAAKNFEDREGRGSARAWLLGLAANLVRRHRRSLARLTARVASWARQPSEPTAMSPLEALDAKEAAARGKRALDRLSQEKREVFVLVAMEGLSGQDAALALGVPVATIWTRLHRARRALRESLLEETT